MSLTPLTFVPIPLGFIKGTQNHFSPQNNFLAAHVMCYGSSHGIFFNFFKFGRVV